MNLMLTGDHIAPWLSRLVRLPSVTPLQAGPRAGEPGEAKIAAEVASIFRELGGEVIVEEVLPGRPNTFGLFKGRSDRWAGVDVHLDTVGVESAAGDPFSGRIDAGRVWGRGATDTKATLAVALALLEDARRRGVKPGPTLLIAATADEEGTAKGAPAMAAWLRKRGLALDELAVAEPTECVPVHGHKGVLRIVFTVEGVACHSSKPHLGKNAVAAAAKIVAAFEEEHARLARAGEGNTLGPGTLTVTMFHGGEGVSVVPPSCEVTFDRRITAGERAAAERERLTGLARRACPLPLTARVVHEIDSFYQPPETPWVTRMEAWSGRRASIVPYCTNAWAYTPDVARQCLVIGPGSIDQAHTADEWVAVNELEKLAGVFAKWWGVN